jgi:RNA polymerase sigma-70 factor (ECF subfamily)
MGRVGKGFPTVRRFLVVMHDFGSFYVARRDLVLRVVAAATGSASEAEDAVAEAFTRACDRWTSVREHADPTAWVIRTALNCQRSWWRRRTREVYSPAADRAAPEPEAGIPEDLRRLIAGLPRRQREALALRVIAGLSAEQTAQVLGIAPATVHVHLHRALSTLRTQLPAPQTTAQEERK